MNPIPEAIFAHLQNHQVLSMAISHDDMPWSANAFFAYDNALQRLLILSSQDTRHAQMLSINPRVAGTVAAQFSDISQIHGLQFYGHACVLEQPKESESALQIYYQRFPQARQMQAPIWQISLLQLKLTDNRLGFGHKTHWSKTDPKISS